MALTGDAKQLADNDGDPGHAADAHARHQSRAGALNAEFFGLRVDHEPRLVRPRGVPTTAGSARVASLLLQALDVSRH